MRPLMNRIRTAKHAEPIAHALDLLPPGIRARLAHVHFLAGSDPIFIGLHRYETSTDGRSYADMAHAVYPFHMEHLPRDQRVTTIVTPEPVEPWVVIHELGHALDEAISFDHHDPRPVTEYATVNRWEAFAEAFTAWICPDTDRYMGVQDELAQDAETLELFSELARCPS